MKSPLQTTLPTMPDWNEQQPVPYNALVATIAEANAAGFTPWRMDTVRTRGEYRVAFRQLSDAQVTTIERIVTNGHLAACKPATAPNAASVTKDATAASTETAWRDVVARQLQKQSGNPTNLRGAAR